MFCISSQRNLKNPVLTTWQQLIAEGSTKLASVPSGGGGGGGGAAPAAAGGPAAAEEAKPEEEEPKEESDEDMGFGLFD